MIPEQRKATPVGGQILQPDGKNGIPLTTDFEVGGVDLSDSSQGFLVKTWQAQVVDGTEIWVFPENDPDDKTLVVTDVNITEVTFSFDQLMQATVAYVADGQSKIYYYDSVATDFVKLNIDGVSPFATLDDKRKVSEFLGENDVLVFYLDNGDLHYRAQRDRYDTEYTLLEDVPGPAERILKCGMDTQYRMQVELLIHEESGA